MYSVMCTWQRKYRFVMKFVDLLNCKTEFHQLQFIVKIYFGSVVFDPGFLRLKLDYDLNKQSCISPWFKDSYYLFQLLEYLSICGCY